jgi:hypothetical protein
MRTLRARSHAIYTNLGLHSCICAVRGIYVQLYAIIARHNVQHAGAEWNAEPSVRAGDVRHASATHSSPSPSEMQHTVSSGSDSAQCSETGWRRAHLRSTDSTHTRRCAYHAMLHRTQHRHRHRLVRNETDRFRIFAPAPPQSYCPIFIVKCVMRRLQLQPQPRANVRTKRRESAERQHSEDHPRHYALGEVAEARNHPRHEQRRSIIASS